ncbi:MAG: SGNH/GDSL hydrolase family protein [Alphaproteobacteria bacterium]
MFRGVLVAAAAAVLLFATAAQANDRAMRCRVGPEHVHFRAPLDNFISEVKRNQIVRIVALGSSSTAGSGASNPQSTYPARLDLELDRRFPWRDFVVINRGIGGETARQMYARIDHDVLPDHPSLVIWQTGVNDAIQAVPVAEFRDTLRAGIEKLRAERIDVVLVDLQFYPKAERLPGYTDYLRAMRDVARETNAAYFNRFKIMKHLVQTGRFTAAELLSQDQFHMNDLSYGCLALQLADGLAEKMYDSVPPSFNATVLPY